MFVQQKIAQASLYYLNRAGGSMYADCLRLLMNVSSCLSILNFDQLEQASSEFNSSQCSCPCCSSDDENKSIFIEYWESFIDVHEGYVYLTRPIGEFDLLLLSSDETDLMDSLFDAFSSLFETLDVSWNAPVILM